MAGNAAAAKIPLNVGKDVVPVGTALEICGASSPLGRLIQGLLYLQLARHIGKLPEPRQKTCRTPLLQGKPAAAIQYEHLSLIHISEPTRRS